MIGNANGNPAKEEPLDLKECTEEGEISLTNLRRLQKSSCQICKERKGNLKSELQVPRMLGLYLLAFLLQQPQSESQLHR